jgi:DNA-binding HxlR family transcriptional regulator
LSEELYDPTYASLPDKLLELPRSLFHPDRFRIMFELYNTSTADFAQLQRDLGLSEGALATHVRTLERDGLIEPKPEQVGGRKRTGYLLTKKGVDAIITFLDDFAKIREAIPQ